MSEHRKQLRMALDARREELEKERQLLEAKAEDLQRKMVQVTKALDSIDALLRVEFGGAELTYSDMGITTAAADVLRKNDGPLHVKEIMNRMQAGGYRTKAKRPVAMLSGTLQKSPRFKRVGKDEFALEE